MNYETNIKRSGSEEVRAERKFDPWRTEVCEKSDLSRSAGLRIRKELEDLQAGSETE